MLRKRSSAVVAVTLIGLATSSLSAQNWPQFRGPNRDGISTETGLYRQWPAGGPKELWRVELGEGYAAPAVFDGRVYINDYDESTKSWLVRCLSLVDGKEIWRHTEKKPIRPNHLITRTVPAVDGKYVFSLDPKCVFHCLDAKTGNELWKQVMTREYKTRIPPWYAGQCPLLEDDRVLLAPGGSALVVALEKATGKPVWSTPNEEKFLMSHASLMPAELCGVKQYLYCTLKGLQGVSAETGELLWFFPSKFNIAVAVSPLPVGTDRVFMTNQYNADSVMIRLTNAGGKFHAEEVFRFTVSKWNSEVHTPILVGEHMYAVSKKKRGQFTCLDLDGKIVWASETAEGKPRHFGLGSFLLADGMFFVLDGDSGELCLVEANPTEYKELASAAVLEGDNVWAPMALSGGRLLLRDTTKMVCIEVGPVQGAPAGD